MHKNKFKAIRTTINGVTFASKKEANYYWQLKLRERAGEVSHIELQPTYDIIINGQHICKVKLDFRYYDNRDKCYHIVDVKGLDTPVSKLKRKLVNAQHNICVEIV